MLKVLVRGPALTRSGYGEHTRFILRSLKRLEDEIDLYVVPLAWGQTGWVVDDDEEREWLDALIHKTTAALNAGNFAADISLQVTIPNEWEKLAPINIGVTAGIETTKMAPIWCEKSNLMDYLIVTSEHAKEVFERTSYQVTVQETGQVIPDYRCATDIQVVSYPVKEFEDLDLNLELENDFNFLAIAQWGPRKNIINCVQWFLEEFIDQEVGLVLKTNLAKNSILDRTKVNQILTNIVNQEKYKNRKCKLYLLHGDMSDQEVHQLYRHPKIKAFVSTSHGEGFGLPHFEAAYEGMPVIAPDWSGHVDFLHMPISDKKGKTKRKAMYSKVDYTLQPVQPEAVWEGVIPHDAAWCYPDQGSFKIKLREVYKDYGRFKKQAGKLQKYLIDNVTFENQSDLVCQVVKKFLPSEEEQEWLNKLDEIEVL
tara:strand:+ start:1349 stop:2623 length:1275 start_codon:yes stop_codon:yes gene_type:complete